MDVFENDLRSFRHDLDEINNFRGRRTKLYRIKMNPLVNMNYLEFRRKYRFSKENMKKIIDLLKLDLEVDRRGGVIPVDIQVMAVIRYWGRHEIQDDCADIHGMSQQTLSRLCKKVAIALASKASLFIKMPATLQEQRRAINNFQAICGFPNVIGAIDCTHIHIRKVGGVNGLFYVNRKGVYSINTQVVCDASLKIIEFEKIICHWRGSTHDARIYRESSIKQRLESNEFHGRLLGDSGYPCTPFLFTPVLRPQTVAENRYNISHIQTRNVVERCGLLKQRFRILLEVMRGSLTTIKTTIIACAVLHNLALEFHEIDNGAESVHNNGEDFHEDDMNLGRNENNTTRQVFINTHFN